MLKLKRKLRLERLKNRIYKLFLSALIVFLIAFVTLLEVDTIAKGMIYIRGYNAIGGEVFIIIFLCISNIITSIYVIDRYVNEI